MWKSPMMGNFMSSRCSFFGPQRRIFEDAARNLEELQVASPYLLSPVESHWEEQVLAIGPMVVGWHRRHARVQLLVLVNCAYRLSNPGCGSCRSHWRTNSGCCCFLQPNGIKVRCLVWHELAAELAKRLVPEPTVNAERRFLKCLRDECCCSLVRS